MKTNKFSARPVFSKSKSDREILSGPVAKHWPEIVYPHYGGLTDLLFCGSAASSDSLANQFLFFASGK